jgi:drug/metabolite transporter (DMT)-like permease
MSSIAGRPLQVAALIWASIVVVQPALAAGLLLLLAISSRLLGEPPRRRDVIATLGIVLGIAVLALAAPPQDDRHAHGAVLALALVGLAVIVATPYVIDRLGRGNPTATVLGAGAGYATGGMTTALAAYAVHRGAWFEALAWAAATAVASGSGLLSEMSALQERPAIHVAPVVFTIQTILPVALAPWLLHANIDSDQVPTVIAALAVVVAGSWALSRSPRLQSLGTHA